MRLTIFKAYVQQLESSKLKLASLEQELQKALQQVSIYWPMLAVSSRSPFKSVISMLFVGNLHF